MMHEMMQKFSDVRPQHGLDLAKLVTRGVDKFPFIKWIQNEPKPKDFMILSLPTFNGKWDPLSHLFQLQQKMALEVNNEAIHCKVFSGAFYGLALLWFRQLKPGSINDFSDFHNVFLQQYNANHEALRTMADLYQIEQAESEHPRPYLQRFINLVHQFHDVDPTIVANLFVKSLQVGTLLHEDLILTPPYDMTEIQHHVEGVFQVLECCEHAQKRSTFISKPPPENPPSNSQKEKTKGQ
ncbi:uncharacterized protein LOC133785137 [Humulus lupulus]|uniref:uncharacterized protein LOC133785137 n=1 Tax=Humulus lupulus TaxID=3486 RepID=UPI002B415D05|nr:uncharacterized protein LOC133785137 [Humulus lupulus]